MAGFKTTTLGFLRHESLLSLRFIDECYQSSLTLLAYGAQYVYGAADNTNVEGGDILWVNGSGGRQARPTSGARKLRSAPKR